MDDDSSGGVVVPSIVVGNPVASGPQQVILGNPWSGVNPVPIGGFQFALAREASGSVYIGYSGGMTQNSGCMFLSGGANSGMLDGMPINPGGGYFVPRTLVPYQSGAYNIYVRHDAACSGQGRLYFDPI